MSFARDGDLVAQGCPVACQIALLTMQVASDIIRPTSYPDFPTSAGTEVSGPAAPEIAIADGAGPCCTVCSAAWPCKPFTFAGQAMRLPSPERRSLELQSICIPTSPVAKDHKDIFSGLLAPLDHLSHLPIMHLQVTTFPPNIGNIWTPSYICCLAFQHQVGHTTL